MYSKPSQLYKNAETHCENRPGGADADEAKDTELSPRSFNFLGTRQNTVLSFPYIRLTRMALTCDAKSASADSITTKCSLLQNTLAANRNRGTVLAVQKSGRKGAAPTLIAAEKAALWNLKPVASCPKPFQKDTTHSTPRIDGIWFSEK